MLVSINTIKSIVEIGLEYITIWKKDMKLVTVRTINDRYIPVFGTSNIKKNRTDTLRWEVYRTIFCSLWYLVAPPFYY